VKLEEGLIVGGVILIILGAFWLLLTYVPLQVLIPLRPWIVIILGALSAFTGYLSGRTKGGVKLALSATYSSAAIIAFIVLLTAFIPPVIPFTPYTVSKPFSYSYTTEGVDTLELSIDFPNGDVVVRKADVNYINVTGRIDIHVYLIGTYEEHFEEKVKPRVEVKRGEGVLYLDVRSPSAGIPLWYTIEVEVLIPQGLKTTLRIDLTNGKVRVEGGYENVFVDVSNGEVDLDVDLDVLEVDLSNGMVSGRVSASKATIDLTNGEVSIRVPGDRSGEVTVDLTVGSIKVKASPKAGYLIDASTSVGSVDVNLGGVAESGRRLKLRTPNYDVAPVKVKLTLDVSVGSITVEEG